MKVFFYYRQISQDYFTMGYMDPAQDPSSQNPQNTDTPGQANTSISPTQSQNSQIPTNPNAETSQAPQEVNQQTSNPITQGQVETAQAPNELNQVVQASGLTSSPPKFRFLIPLLLMLFFILLTSGVLGGSYMVAYEKVKLTKFPKLQKGIASVVMSLPFMPKTPKYLITKSALAHQGVTKESYNISVAIDSADFSKTLGLNKIDLEAKGAVDYSNPKDIKITLDASITKDFNFEIRKKDNFLYFKINKLPTLLLSFFGLKSDSFNSVLGKWVSYDTSPLNTEARKSMEDKEVDPLSQEFVDEAFQKYIDEKVLGKIKVEKGSDDNFNVYILSLDADSELIDYLGKIAEEQNKKRYGATLYGDAEKQTKLSDMVKNLKWKFYIDEREYYLRKIVVTSDLEVDNLGNYSQSFMMGTSTNLPQKSQVAISFAAKFGDFGQGVTIDTPQDSMKFEEFTNSISQIMMEVYGSLYSNANQNYTSLNPTEQFSKARDSQRLSDLHSIQAALELFKADCKTYPDKLEILNKNEPPQECNKGLYLTTIPKDPVEGEYYYKSLSDGESYNLCAKLESRTDLMNKSCPNSSYNYHLQNP